jgi:ribose/xylose/arabinose/galactoside ABC-type transport system permease subunit
METAIRTTSTPAASRPLSAKLIDGLLEYGVHLSLVAIFVVFAVSYGGRFLSSTNLLEGVAHSAAITIIIGVGITIALACGQIDISGGAQMALGSLVFTGLIPHDNMQSSNLFGLQTNIWAALLASLLTVLLVGLLNGFLIVDLGIFSLLATFPSTLLVFGTAAMLESPHGAENFLVPGTREWTLTQLPNRHFLHVALAVWVAAAVVIVGWVVLEKTRYGWHVQACGANPGAARRVGIRVNRVTRSVFLLSSVTAFFAALVAMAATGSGGPNVGGSGGGAAASGLTGPSFNALTAVLIGGAAISGGGARIGRTVLGGALVAVIGNGLTLSGLSIFIQGVVTGVIFILALLLSSFASIRRRDG